MSIAAPLPEPLRQALADLVRQCGEHATVRRLKISRQTLARALAGLRLYPGSHALIRERLANIDIDASAQ
jgi:hypothetical protein